ncbi:MaoC family protein [Actinokineospora spheciospongiae]|uniref:MaoC family protein n=1 Tax=Actinokineospora spheciospongiae TaxID=909613 RepID=W7JBV8_9PSEU|nr:MaoC/PaaZ C-terminal domain-containing protein [Actinokineospora spheciospongiae]EWC63519.1 MaoC family protein [Actinokineospora spheciospongiae]PWW64269.1 MaoC dehydratase-like protein [Actinokineospora spheciospongiae]
MSALEKGAELPPLQVRLTRADLVRYAGAALDHNPIHWNERFAKEVGLPDVIAHGMLTMGVAGRVVTEARVGTLVSYSARFTRPVVVPDDDKGALVELSAKVGAVLDNGDLRIDITARFDGRTVLGKAIAIVRP